MLYFLILIFKALAGNSHFFQCVFKVDPQYVIIGPTDLYAFLNSVCSRWYLQYIENVNLHFSILGVRFDASDEDIKKYYRKQAVLVHPDKVSLGIKQRGNNIGMISCSSQNLYALGFYLAF